VFVVWRRGRAAAQVPDAQLRQEDQGAKEEPVAYASSIRSSLESYKKELITVKRRGERREGGGEKEGEGD
jgi:hypothetical protein